MDLMKPYMPPTRENYQRVLKDIHARTIQMWAGCIWVPIYEVMTRKHLTMVTLEENLEMAADIGIDATTSLDAAFAEAMERHGPRCEGDRAPVRALPAAAEHRRMDAEPLRSRRRCSRTDAAPVRGVGAARGTEPPRRRRTRSAARRRSSSCSAATRTARRRGSCPGLALPCAHCGGAFHEPLTMAAKRHKRDPRAVLEAFRALEQAGRRPSRSMRRAAAQRDPLPRRRRPDARRRRRGQGPRGADRGLAGGSAVNAACCAAALGADAAVAGRVGDDAAGRLLLATSPRTASARRSASTRRAPRGRSSSSTARSAPTAARTPLRAGAPAGARSRRRARVRLSAPRRPRPRSRARRRPGSRSTPPA